MPALPRSTTRCPTSTASRPRRCSAGPRPRCRAWPRPSLGGWAGDRLRDRFPGSYFLVSGAAMLVAFPLLLLTINLPFPLAWLPLAGFVFCLFFNTGPTNTILANVTHPQLRAPGFAFNILLIHLFGDVVSPPIMGAITDAFDMKAAFYAVSGTVLLGGLVWLWGALPRGGHPARPDPAARELSSGFEVPGSRCEDLTPQPPLPRGEGEPEACRKASRLPLVRSCSPSPCGRGGWGVRSSQAAWRELRNKCEARAPPCEGGWLRLPVARRVTEARISRGSAVLPESACGTTTWPNPTPASETSASSPPTSRPPPKTVRCFFSTARRRTVHRHGDRVALGVGFAVAVRLHHDLAAELARRARRPSCGFGAFVYLATHHDYRWVELRGRYHPGEASLHRSRSSNAPSRRSIASATLVYPGQEPRDGRDVEQAPRPGQGHRDPLPRPAAIGAPHHAGRPRDDERLRRSSRRCCTG